MIQPRETEPGMSNAVAAALQDTVSALRFIRDNATRFCSDPSKVVLYGRSAGAITVLNVAYMDGKTLVVMMEQARGMTRIGGGRLPSSSGNQLSRGNVGDSVSAIR